MRGSEGGARLDAKGEGRWERVGEGRTLGFWEKFCGFRSVEEGRRVWVWRKLHPQNRTRKRRGGQGKVDWKWGNRGTRRSGEKN